MMTAIVDYVADRFCVDRGSVSFGLYSGTKGVSGFVVVLFYVDQTPLAVCRIPRTRERSIAPERERLDEVNESVSGDPFLERTVESVLFTAEIEGRSVLFTEHMHGRPASHSVTSGDPRRVRRHLRSITDWLVGFLEETADLRSYDPAEKRASLDELSGSPESRSADAFVADETQFVAPMHGDFECQNVLLSGNGRVTGVVDWEDARLEGVPLYDLVSLLVDAAWRREGEDAVECMFFEQGWLSEVAYECVSRFCSSVGISTRSFARALPLYVDIHRNVEYTSDWSPGESRFYDDLRDALDERNDEIVWLG